MPRYFIHMAFDGTAYHGWQVQPGSETIQKVTEHAFSTLLGREVSLTGAGRTDAGVHASFFIAHFDMPPSEAYEGKAGWAGPEDEQFIFRLNRFLPEDIVVYRIRQVPEEIHARYSATYRTYQYHISTVKPLYTRNYSHYLYGPLNTEEINRCCRILLEISDFTSFSKLHTDVSNNHCHVMAAEWKEVDHGYMFEIRANRFLRNMVRSLVGTLLEVGQGKLDREGFRQIIEAKERSKAGASVPAQGLFLVDIGYEGIFG